MKTLSLMLLSQTVEFIRKTLKLTKNQLAQSTELRQLVLDVGLSMMVLLSQHNPFTAVDIIPEKVEKLNKFVFPIQDEYIGKYLAETRAGKRELNLTATIDGATTYSDAEYIIIAAPTNYDPKQNFFDCSDVESVVKLILDATAKREIKLTILI